MNTDQALAIVEHMKHYTDEEVCVIRCNGRQVAGALQSELAEHGYQAYVDFGGQALRVFLRRSESEAVPSYGLGAEDAMAIIVCGAAVCFAGVVAVMGMVL